MQIKKFLVNVTFEAGPGNSREQNINTTLQQQRISMILINCYVNGIA